MGTMSDSQFEFEDKYDDDFDDDVSADDNNQNDSGMEEKVAYRNSYDTDTDNETFRNKTGPSRTPKKSNGKLNGKDKKTPVRSSDPYKSYLAPTRRAQSDPRGRKPKKPIKMASSGNKGGSSRPSVNNSNAPNAVIKRVLSASRKKTSSLHNIIYELQQQIEALSIDNRDLKRNTRVQDRDLRKLDSAEAQLPVLMKKHSNELNVLQEKYKRQKEVSISLTENIKKVDNELLKTKDKLKEYQTMVKEKKLGERIELKNNISNLEKVIEEKDNKISELNRNLNLQKKAHSRIIKEKNEKYEKAREKVKILEEVQKDLVSRLKDREKALEVTNIYSRRVQKDGKQMVMFSPNDPIAPILKKCQEENLETLQTLHAKSKITEKNEKETPFNISSVGDRIDTMVSRSDSEHEIQLDVFSPRIEGTVKTFLTEGKLKCVETEDFYDVNDGKEIVKIKKENVYQLDSKITKGKKKSDNPMEVDSLGEEELHEKLDQMIEKRKGKDRRMEFIDKDKVNVSIKKESIEIVEKERESVQQLQLEESVDKMSIFEKESPKKSPVVDDGAKKRRLLLAKIQAIDNGENPNDVTPSSVNLRKMNEKKSKPYKKPIFLEGSPKSSANTSDDDLASVKSSDAYSSSNSKSNSANSKSRRIRPFPDSYSGNETDSPVKTRERKDSMEFKSTDENLHKGLPAHTDTTSNTISNRKLAPKIRNNDRSLTGSLGQANNDTVNGNKNRINVNKSDRDNNAQSRYDISYSPTALDINTGQNRKTSKKNGFNLFDQFEDPFKYSSSNKTENDNLQQVSDSIKFKNASPGNPSGKKQDEDGELFAKTNKGAQTPDSMVLDDLEEMFIL